MAAGQHNTSTKRYSSKEETRPLQNEYKLKTLSSGCDHGITERTLSSGGRSRDDTRRNAYVDVSLRSLESVRGGSYGMSEHSSEFEGRSKEDTYYEDRSRVSSEKKRKFAPVMWDRNEKHAKVYSKNRIVTTSSVVSHVFSPESSKDSGKLTDIVLDVRNAGCPVVDGELLISPAESLVSDISDGVGVPNSFVGSTPVTKPEQHTEDEQDLGKMEEGEYVEERNLTKSKWAIEDSPDVASDESGDFKQEPFEGRDESSLSYEAVQSENESHDEGVMGNVYGKVASSGMGYFSSGDDCDDDHTIQTAEMPNCSAFTMHECRNVFVYERLNKISEGTYGVVYKARDKNTGDIVALKKVKLGKEREGFPLTALREINMLRSFNHPSIVEVKEVVMDDFDGVYMVMDYIDHELKGYMESMKQPFTQSEIKCLMIQLLEGLSYLHDNWVIHRDLKTSNLLLNNKGELKICDFGMSRQYGSPLKPYTPLVVTLWYRAPEILLGMKQYSTAIDMWSVGCIMAELLAKKPLFDGNRELEQVDKIFRTLGTPNDLVWPGYSKLPGVKPNFVKQPYNCLRKRFPVATFTGSPVLTELGFDLLNKLLTYDPSKRITAEDALNHGWFREAPLPAQHVRICK